MRINARLDQARSRKLNRLKKVTRSNVSEIIRRAIDGYYNQVDQTAGDSAALLAESGLIGCGVGPRDLSLNYKQELLLHLNKKHGHR